MGTPAEERVTLELVVRCLGYRGNGELTWKDKVSPSSSVKIGDVAGSVFRSGSKKYMAVHIKGEKILVHRIIWALHNDRWPEGHIDHIDGDETNNAIENLREVTRSQNNMNRSNRSDNMSGLKGAKLRKNRDGSPVWVSSIWINGKSKYLGRFKTPEEAHAAYVKAANENFGEFARAA
ncbi:HNH endonuclease [Rhizobium leguminosarum]|nr:HNH endonuclease [Rhizobium leguminosarum]